MKIGFHSNANKTNFHMKRFALSLAFIMRFTATHKWPIDRGVLQNLISVKYGYGIAVGGGNLILNSLLVDLLGD